MYPILVYNSTNTFKSPLEFKMICNNFKYIFDFILLHHINDRIKIMIKKIIKQDGLPPSFINS
jgi:hypothetical protein